MKNFINNLIEWNGAGFVHRDVWIGMGNIVQQELIPVDEISCMSEQENSIMASSRRCNDINYYCQLRFFFYFELENSSNLTY